MDTTHYNILYLLDQKTSNYKKLIQIRSKFNKLIQNTSTFDEKNNIYHQKKQEINPIKYKLEEIELQLTIHLKTFFLNQNLTNSLSNDLSNQIWTPH